jgi:two-component system chemotaxis sensor kinase CheA
LFFETAGELVQKLNDEAMQLEKSPGDAETARSLRRTVHTLKGDAAACGFRELSELSHEFEDVLTLGNTAAAAAVPEIALRAADVFAALLEAYRKGTKLPSIQSLRTDIARLAHPAGSALPAKQKKKKAAPKTSLWSEYEQLAIARAAAEGKRVHHVAVQVDPQCGMPIAARQMVQLALAELGEVLALYPVEGSAEPGDRIEAALASEKPAEQIRAKCSIPTIALNVRVKPLRAPAPSYALPRLPLPILRTRTRTRCLQPSKSPPSLLPPLLPGSLSLPTTRRQPGNRRRPPCRAVPTTYCAWMRKESTAYSIWSGK